MRKNERDHLIAKKYDRKVGNTYMTGITNINGDKWIIDARDRRNSNKARLVNHSCDPNMKFEDRYNENHNLRMYYVAIKDIDPGS